MAPRLVPGCGVLCLGRKGTSAMFCCAKYKQPNIRSQLEGARGCSRGSCILLMPPASCTPSCSRAESSFLRCSWANSSLCSAVQTSCLTAARKGGWGRFEAKPLQLLLCQSFQLRLSLPMPIIFPLALPSDKLDAVASPALMKGAQLWFR